MKTKKYHHIITILYISDGGFAYNRIKFNLNSKQLTIKVLEGIEEEAKEKKIKKFQIINHIIFKNSSK